MQPLPFVFFRRSSKEAAAQNKINAGPTQHVGDPNTWSCENPLTLKRDLKARLGFQGWVMSDWGACHSASIMQGLDQEMPGQQYMSPDAIKAKLQSKNVFHIAQRNPGGATTMYFSARVMAPNKEILCELTLPPASKGINGCKLCVKTEHVPIAALVTGMVKATLTQ